jgi:archaellum component FlaD/FlaE
MSARKPYVTHREINGDNAELAVEWMELLADTFGIGGALYSLKYYEMLGWLSGDARERLTGYLRGLSMDELHNKKYDEPGTVQGPLSAFSGTPFGVHAKSLEYVTQLTDEDLREKVLVSKLAENRVTEGESNTDLQTIFAEVH